MQFPAQPIAGIDLDFRPASYWDAADPVVAITQNIKGQLRREMVRDFISAAAAPLPAEDPCTPRVQVAAVYLTGELTDL